MKTLIYGAGPIGRWLALRLARTATDVTLLARNEELFPLDEEGQKKFGEAVQRWTSLFKKDEGGDGDGDGDGSGDGEGDGDGQRQASVGAAAGSFDPGSGSHTSSQAGSYTVKRYGEK